MLPNVGLHSQSSILIQFFVVVDFVVLIRQAAPLFQL